MEGENDIITSKEHGTEEVMVYFSPVGENCREIFLLNSKCKFSLVLLK